MKNRLTKKEQVSDRTELALEERGSGKISSEKNDLWEDEHDAATKRISNFLNEPINTPGEHVQVEMQDLEKKNSKIIVHERMPEYSDNSCEESYTEYGDSIEDKSSKIKTSTNIKFQDPIGKNRKHLLPQQRRRSKMLSWMPSEQALDETSVSMPKRSGIIRMDPGQKYLAVSNRNGAVLGSRKIEILVEESVSSTTESHIPGNTEYGFQICSSDVTESREMYVVQRTKRNTSDDLKLTMMCVIIVAVFFISWFPFVVTMLIESLTTIKIPTAVDKATLLIGYLNSLSNPIIYCYFNKNFRSQLKKIICKRRMRKTAYYGRR